MADSRDFLLEIGCEELPSAPLIHAIDQLGKLISKGLNEAGLAHGDVTTLSSPRRLSVMVSSVAEATEEVHQVMRGPAAAIAFDADGNPTKAAQGFARGKGLDVSDLVTRQDEDGKTYVFAEVSTPSRSAFDILGSLCEEVIPALDWPRSQRWGANHERFGRPVRWICCLFGNDVVPVSFADVTSSNVTFGHRVLSPGAHVVENPAAYVSVLESAHVLGEKRRREVINQGIERIESEVSGHVDTPKRVFDEVVNLCEWPTVLVGRFDEEFLAVPHEIICESMLTNQRYFPIYSPGGDLMREFVVVSNGDPTCSETIVDGNERVVRARLDDAKFFYEEDLKQPLDSYVDRLSTVVFQEKLGTVLQKTQRMEHIAPEVARVSDLDAVVAAHATRAAHLAKADLVTQAVIEFTSQQGVMGGYYAHAAGEPDDVCDAIRDQYRPRFAGDELPADQVGRCVAVADKLDTICGMFAIDEPPTGSSDPFAVRRSAIGVINILREMPEGDLARLIQVSLGAYAGQGLEFDMAKTSSSVEDFFLGRLATIAREEGVSPDTIDAVSSVRVIDPKEYLMRAHALEDARSGEPELFDDLAVAYARAAHLGDASLGCSVDESLLSEPERALLDACEAGETAVADALGRGEYSAAIAALANLREPIDRFFDEVLVMDDDEAIRTNRVRLLNRFAGVFGDVADIGALARKK
ncbi:MAG: glycine--tRNA ligase subunit beta [Atopobiaceae bacterium]|jgi:glycyl-tRNA synthetase beta chain|nr:glycine--tRNA ligase subunit beta [Atopobiaceae bacterium]MCI2173165.1 glycine--tRNA ligase subunit beta [Atopobiaceae bacterium]MCI2208258.1 glycine--tRNA ligase subunit beta [Atopobiaceae bacterium]